MVGKLIKHEFIRTRGLLGTIFAVSTALTLGGVTLVWLDWPVIGGFGQFLAIAGVVAVIPVTQLALAIDYWRVGYRQAGYLTHTLPVRGRTIYLTKLAYATLAAVASVALDVVLAASSAAVASRIAPGVQLAQWWAKLAETLALFPAWSWVLLVLLALLVLVLPLVELFFAASVGSEKTFASLGVGGPVLVWFLLYLAMQVWVILTFVLIPVGIVGRQTGYELVHVNFLHLLVTNTQPDVVPVGFVPGFVVAAVVLVWRTVVSWERRVSLR